MPVVKKRPTGRGLRTLRKLVKLPVPRPLPMKVWAMRKLNWIEIRISRVRPKRIISRMEVGEMRLVGYGWDGGEHVGMLPYAVGGYIRHPEGDGFRYLRVPEMRNGQTIELDDTLGEMILDTEKREKLFT